MSDLTLLCIHGYPLDHRMWGPLAERLERVRSCRVVAPDLRGRGASSWPAADVHAMSASTLKQTIAVDRFVASWRDAVDGRGPFTGFEISNAGDIDLAFIPSLEDVPQAKFVAFLEIAFSNPQQEDAFTIGAVLLTDGGQVRVGALHAR